MKFLLFVTIFCSLAVCSLNSQGTHLYDEGGRLRCDSTFQVDVEFLGIIKRIENCLINIYESKEYPEIAYENGIEGLIIIKLNVDNKKLSICAEIAKRLDPAIDKEVLNAISKNELGILRNTAGIENFSFYLPFRFETTTIPIMEDLKKHGVIRIRSQELVPTKVLL